MVKRYDGWPITHLVELLTFPKSVDMQNQRINVLLQHNIQLLYFW